VVCYKTNAVKRILLGGEKKKTNRKNLQKDHQKRPRL